MISKLRARATRSFLSSIVILKWTMALSAFCVSLLSARLGYAAEPLQIKVAGCRPAAWGEFKKGYSGRGYSNAEQDQGVEMLIAYHTASPGDDPDEALEQVESIEVCIMEGTPANPTISCPASSNAEWLVYQ